MVTNEFCVYLTTYRGSALPPFYIGSSSVSRVFSGYHGSVNSIKYGKIWKTEMMLAPHKFKTQIVSYHHTRKEALETEQKLQRLLNVVKSSMYVNMSLATPNGFHGMDVSGRNNPRYGLPSPKKGKTGYPYTQSESSKIQRIKKLKAFNQKFWNSDSDSPETLARREKFKLINGGEENPMFGKTGADNPNFGRKNSAETKLKMSNSAAGRKKSKEHIKKLSKTYAVESEITHHIFIGYGLTAFCRSINAGPALMLYHFTNTTHKFINGYRIISNLGAAKESTPKLTDLIL